MISVDPRVFQAMSIASGLKLYASTGMKSNRSYTPTNMMRAASAITGKTFKARVYIAAANALREHIGLEPFK